MCCVPINRYVIHTLTCPLPVNGSMTSLTEEPLSQAIKGTTMGVTCVPSIVAPRWASCLCTFSAIRTAQLPHASVTSPSKSKQRNLPCVIK